MKKIMSMVLAIVLVITGISIHPQRVKAMGENLPGIAGSMSVPYYDGDLLSSGEWRYYVDHGEAFIAGYSNTGERNLRIPYELGGYAVRGIGSKAFVSFEGLKIQCHSLIDKIAADAFPRETVISGYSGSYAHVYADTNGYRKNNLTDGLGAFTFRDGIIDFAGFPDKLYKAKSNYAEVKRLLPV